MIFFNKTMGLLKSLANIYISAKSANNKRALLTRQVSCNCVIHIYMSVCMYNNAEKRLQKTCLS